MTAADKLRHKAQSLKINNPFFCECIKFLFFSFIITAMLVNSKNMISYRWQWYRIPDYIVKSGSHGFSQGPLIEGLKVTLFISAVSLLLTVITGFITALFRLSGSFTANLLSRVYLEAIRNTPLLIQLFLIYFVVSPILGIGRILSAVIALSLFEGAYTSEIIRSGIISIDKGQWEAGRSLGMTEPQLYMRIVLPQALRQILPILSGQAISLVKDSALVSTIAIYDLTMQGQVAISKSFLTFEIWFTVAAIYLIINTAISFLIRLLEKHLKKKVTFGG